MTRVLLDTHIWAWSLIQPSCLPPNAHEAITTATAVHVSPISLYEIGQKVRLGKWPEMAPVLPELPDLLHRQNGVFATLTAEICAQAARMNWLHRDPFDRLIAATAMLTRLDLISSDTTFDTAPPGPGPLVRIG